MIIVAAVPVKMIEKPSCPDNITEVASRESLRSNIEISVSGLTQSIELPIGTHSYYLSYDGISCPLSINVIGMIPADGIHIIHEKNVRVK